MLKYAKIIDPEKGTCEVGIGDPDAVYSTVTDTETGEEKIIYVSDFYKSLGMELMEVEEVDGQWYVKGKAPAPPETVTIRIFSKYKLCDTTSQIPFTLADGTQTTVWEAFKSFITAAGKKDLWDNIIEVAEDNRHFIEAVPIAIENFGTELVEQVLSASVERVETKIKGE